MTPAAFIRHLRGLDARSLSALRRSQESPGTDPATFPLIERAIGDRDGWPREAHYAVAILWARANINPPPSGGDDDDDDSDEPTEPTIAPAGTWRSSFGGAIARLRGPRPTDPLAIERRFEILIDSAPDQILHNLEALIRRCRQANIRIPWARLLGDLIRWDDEGRPVQRAWMRDYARGLAALKNEAGAADGAADGEEDLADA